MESSNDILFASVKSFFANADYLKQLTRCLVDHDHCVSLRVIDWLVTNYSKKKNVAYIFHDFSGEERIFNVYLEYKSQLKSFSKSLFDPFKRGPRIQFADCYGKPFETTIGQLNFFKWAIRHGVVEYATRHVTDIERDMVESTRKRTEVPTGKRSHLSKMQPCTTTMLKVKVTFK